MEFELGFGYIPVDYHSHWDNFYELHFFTRGEGFFEFLGRKIPLRPHLLLVSPPREEHSLTANDPLIFHNLKVSDPGESGALFDSLVDISRERGGIPLNESHSYVFEKIRMLSHMDGEAARNASWFRLISLLYEILIPGENLGFRSLDNVVMRAVHFLRERIQEKVSLDDLSAIVRLNKSYFSRLFKRQMGYAPMDYFIKLKIDAASYLLRESDFTNKEIAVYFSFTDEYYFSKLFKTRTGQTPSEYRRKVRQQRLT